MPLVSVIIPNYNHAPFLKQRIESVLNQTFQDFEVIILDDCSTDNSREIIELHKRHSKISHVVYNKENSGNIFKQWQKGIELAVGEYIWIAESDDWAELDFLEVLLTKIDNKPNIGICFSDSNWMDNKGAIGGDLSIHKTDFYRSGIEEIKLHLIMYNTIQNVSAALIKKELALKYINKTLSYKSCGDWCLYINILQESNILFVGKKLNNFRWYHNNTSNKAYKKGLTISEGLKIITFSNAYKIGFTNSELSSIKKYWLEKAKRFKSFLKFKLRIISFVYLSVFKIRFICFRITR